MIDFNHTVSSSLRARRVLEAALAVTCASCMLIACGDDGTTGDDAGSSSGAASTGGPGSTSAVDSTGGAGSSSGSTASTGEPPATDSGGSSSSSDTTAGTDGSGSGSESSTGAGATVQLDVTFASFLGAPVDGDFCSADGCVAIMAGAASLTLPANSEVDVWVEAMDFVDIHWQLATLDQDIANSFVVPTVTEADTVAGIYGVTLDPAKASVVLGFTAADVSPTIDAPMSEGPYFLAFDGTPLFGATATPMGGSRVIFFNVDPGDWVVSVPGCNEGDDFWGPNGDNEIDVSLTADTVVGLLTTDCI